VSWSMMGADGELGHDGWCWWAGAWSVLLVSWSMMGTTGELEHDGCYWWAGAWWVLLVSWSMTGATPPHGVFCVGSRQCRTNKWVQGVVLSEGQWLGVGLLGCGQG
jgi:hypothetical protein